ncbi:50S ribosomal protein L32 [bacterium]|nr:50S ribosomal protein L32 [bacterium]
MPVPKRKRSRSRRDKRFANKGIKVKSFTECKNCQSPLACHKVCEACGFYKGVKIMTTKADRALKRGQERQAHAKKKGAMAAKAQAAQAATKAQDVIPEEPKK